MDLSPKNSERLANSEGGSSGSGGTSSSTWLTGIRESLAVARELSAANKIAEAVERFRGIIQAYSASVTDTEISVEDFGQALTRICEDICVLANNFQIEQSTQIELKKLIESAIESSAKISEKYLESHELGGPIVTKVCLMMASCPKLQECAIEIAEKWPQLKKEPKCEKSPMVLRYLQIAQNIDSSVEPNVPLTEKCVSKALEVVAALPNPTWNPFERARYYFLSPHIRRDMDECITSQRKIISAAEVALACKQFRNPVPKHHLERATKIVNSTFSLCPRKSHYRTNLRILCKIDHDSHKNSLDQRPRQLERESMIDTQIRK